MAGELTRYRREAAPAQAEPGAERWRCAWSDGAERCHFPGSMCHETRGSERWFCRFHFFCTDPVLGQRIIEQSRDYVRGDPLPTGRDPAPRQAEEEAA